MACTGSCVTLTTTIPDIHSSTNSYAVNQLSALSCFRPYVDPAAPGSSANLIIDDRYSPPLDITFPFSFFGNTYTKLVASTNGFLSFDISKAKAFSHFGILKNGTALDANSGIPEDLPSALYDRALIMGPYHDLDPNVALTTQQIKYDVVGTAPYRKWIISYYNVPLYTTACLNLNKNTQQIVLYETLGIVEIFIFDKGICLNWNNGRAMIGMQNFNKTSAIIAPGRKADSDPWGSKGFNESWRFVPAGGQSLFKKAELYTLSGTFVAAGNIASAANNLLNVSFNNVCPPANSGETYLVKSFYKDPTNLTAEITGIDTITITRGDPIIADITPASCIKNSKGQITITSPIGPQYEYSLDSINWQSSTLFDLSPGSYTINSRIIGSNCISSKKIYLQADTLKTEFGIFNNPCPPPLTGNLYIYPRGGTAPYLYSVDGGALQNSSVYLGLSEGRHTTLIVDAKGCTDSSEFTIFDGYVAPADIKNTICGNAPSGSITINPLFGIGPYVYSLNGGPFQTSNIFTNLSDSTYAVTIQDSTFCTFTYEYTVKKYVLLYANTSVISPKCQGDSNGSFTVHAFPGLPPFQYAINSGNYQADSVFKNLLPGNYNLKIKNSKGCMIDTVVTITQPNRVNGSEIIIPASTCYSSDGEITVKANGGVVPYMYSIDDGKTFQLSNLFTSPVGIFHVMIKDNNNCIARISDTVFAKDRSIPVYLGSDKTICAGSSVKLTVTSDKSLVAYSWTPSKGLSDTLSPTPLASPFDTTLYIINAKTQFLCEGIDSITINVLHKPIANAGIDTIICNNSFAILHGSASDTSGGVSYLWLSPSNDIPTPNVASTIVWPKDARANSYILEVRDNYGCNFKTYDKVIVIMNPPLIVSAGKDGVAAKGVPVQLSGSGGVQYLWSPANVLNDANVQNPLAVLNNDTRFELMVHDTIGCTANSSVFIKVYNDVTYYIPNAFTPNNDGINDVFRAIAPGINKTNYFRIFNRWGKLLYQSQDVTKGWDGNYSGTPQPAAVYVWIVKGLDVSGKIVALKGTVTLVR